MTGRRIPAIDGYASSPPRGPPEATISEHDGVRYLHLDTPWVQGAMRLKKPLEIELEYVQRMMAWLLWRDTAPPVPAGHAVQLGLGAGAITRFTQGALKWRTTAVELNPAVIAANRQWFRLPADGPRMQVVHADAMDWLEAAEPGSVDALCVDLYDHEAAAPVLDDDDFYRACHRVLAEGGLMSVNLFGRDASFERSALRIARAFGPGADGPRTWTMQPTREGNTVVIAARGLELPPRETLTSRAESLQERHGLPARKWIRMIRPLAPSLQQALQAGASDSEDPR